LLDVVSRHNFRLLREVVMQRKIYPLYYYLVISFIEGSALMACELLGAKMIAPFYGASLYVWSSVIGVTLVGLAVGYFSGGFLVDRFPGNTLLFTVLAVGAVLIALMPTSAELVMTGTISLGVRTGSLVSSIVFLVPPLICLGMTSPIIIRLGARDIKHTGRTAGLVYAISTLGGIITTLAMGFYIIPSWGISMPVLVTAAVLGVFPFLYFASRLKLILLLILGTAAAALYLIGPEKRLESASGPTILYHSEGLLGQIVVADAPPSVADTIAPRWLFVNRIPQTGMDKITGYSLLIYAHGMATLASIKPVGSMALVLGLGGGVLMDEFLRLGFQVDGCELEERMVEVARKYFRLSSHVRVTVDDARHYLRMMTKQYDIIAFDLFVGEAQPSYVLTLENLYEVKRGLTDDGLLLINFPGFLTGTPGLASRSIVRTLVEAGFDVKLLPTPGPEALRNLIIIASPQPLDFSKLSVERQNYCCREFARVPVKLTFVTPQQLDLRDAIVLRDDKPIMDLLNLYANESWRKGAMERYDKDFRAFPLF
jgi:predicted membrane-bound spermidine synthase